MVLPEADVRCAHVARRRKREIAWSAGGAELALARESALAGIIDTPKGARIDALVALESRALHGGRGEKRLLITCAMHVPLTWFEEAGVGRERVSSVSIRQSKLVATIERVHAKKVISSREAVPRDDLARQGFVDALLEGRLFAEQIRETRGALAARALKGQLNDDLSGADLDELTLEAWVRRQVVELGIESGEDLSLLSPEDFAAEALPAWKLAELDRTFPRRIDPPDVSHGLEYHPERRQVILRKLRVSRRNTPPLNWLPALKGFAIVLADERGEHVLRPR